MDEVDDIIAEMRKVIEQQAELPVRTDLEPDDDRSDWTTLPVPDNAIPGQWKYNVHPPALSRYEQGSVPMCRCGCLVLTLRKPHNDFDKGMCNYWCLHCGPQVSAVDVNS